MLSDTDATEAPEVSTEEAQEPALARRQDPELVAVPMTPEQEEVYGTLGLNPILLLDEPPESENVMVRVVRPGEDADAVLEQARQQLAATAGRRRLRNRDPPGSCTRCHQHGDDTPRPPSFPGPDRRRLQQEIGS